MSIKQGIITLIALLGMIFLIIGVGFQDITKITGTSAEGYTYVFIGVGLLVLSKILYEVFDLGWRGKEREEKIDDIAEAIKRSKRK